jgi:hypothetical protein
MAIISLNTLKAAFDTGDMPTGSDFTNLIDTTYNFPNSAASVTTGLTLVQTTSGIPVTVNGNTLYIPLFRAS